MKKTLISRTLVAAMLASVASPALAQAEGSTASTGGNAPSTDAASEDENAGGGLQDIIVTATRRSGSLMDVAIAATAVGGEQLESMGVVDTPSLQTATPGVVFTTSAAYAQLYIRGVGNDNTTAGAESSVAVYVDGVYRTQLISGVQSFVDLDRVEVLKGPQGALYGRNAMGGAVNIVTRDPSRNGYTGDISLTYGNFDRREARGYLSGPITKGIAFSVAGMASKSDGFTTNLFNGDRLNDENYQAVRAKLSFELGSDTDFLITGDYFHRNDSRYLVFQQGSPTPLAAFLPQASVLAGLYPPGSAEAFLLSQAPDRPYVGTSDPRETYNDATPSNHLTDKGIAGKLTHQFAGFDVTAITSYRKLDWQALTDLDGSARPLFAFGASKQYARTFTQDLHLASTGDEDSAFSWLAGASFLSDRSGYDVLQQIFPIVGVLQGGVPQVDIRSRIATEAFTVYAQGTYNFNDSVRITGGLRYNTERKRLDFVDTIIPLANLTLPNAAAPASKRWDSFNPSLTLEYRPDENNLLYASYNRGFKSGTFNAVQTGTLPCSGNPSEQCLEPVNPEKIDAYQIGLKSRLLHRSVNLELSGFYYDYGNLQTQFVGLTGATQLQNAASARLYGLDASIRADLGAGFQLSAGTSLLHAKYRRFAGLAYEPDPVAGGNASVNADLSGFDLPRAPRVTGNMGLDYKLPVGSDEFSFSLNAYYSGRYFHDSNNRLREPSYVLLNARATYSLESGASLSLWARNLTNKAYRANVQANGLGDAVQWNEPRVYGATLRYQF